MIERVTTFPSSILLCRRDNRARFYPNCRSRFLRFLPNSVSWQRYIETSHNKRSSFIPRSAPRLFVCTSPARIRRSFSLLNAPARQPFPVIFHSPSTSDQADVFKMLTVTYRGCISRHTLILTLSARRALLEIAYVPREPSPPPRAYTIARTQLHRRNKNARSKSASSARRKRKEERTHSGGKEPRARILAFEGVARRRGIPEERGERDNRALCLQLCFFLSLFLSLPALCVSTIQ